MFCALRHCIAFGIEQGHWLIGAQFLSRHSLNVCISLVEPYVKCSSTEDLSLYNLC